MNELIIRMNRISRRPGRPAQHQTDARPALLDAGLGCVLEHGASAMTVKQIAAAAGLTPASLHYHFGDKPGLVKALIEERVLPALEGLRSALGPGGTCPAAQIRAFVDGVFDMVEKHPWLPRLWLREVLSEGGALREVLLSRIAPVLPRLLAERFAAAQSAGMLNPNLNPQLLVVSLIGLTLFPLAAEPIWGRVFAPAPPAREALREAAFAPDSGGDDVHAKATRALSE